MGRDEEAAITSPDSPVTAAEALEGTRLQNGWLVKERVERRPGATGGLHSVCYRVVNDDGRRGFLKALDYSPAFDAVDQTQTLQILLAAFNFERNIVAACTERRMTHVVQGLDAGVARLPGFGPIINQANYIIFEQADGDSRSHLDAMEVFDEAWALRALHNVAVGLSQLHGAGIAHQDLKPSNVLVMPGVSKVGDVGRSASDHMPGPCDALAAWGDLGYATPELLYGQPLPEVRTNRRATDMYHLGSLLLFFFTRAGTTAAISARLDPELDHRHWQGTFAEVAPFLRDAFDGVVESLGDSVRGSYKPELVALFRQLCDPEPDLRGNPSAPRGTIARFSMERPIAVLDRLARNAELALSKSLQ